MGLPYYVALFFAILAGYLCLLPIILFKRWQAKSTVGKQLPLMQCDCRKEYSDAIKTIRRRLAAVSPVGNGRTEVGFKKCDDLIEYYPAIAFIRFCHLNGYEVEIRPMRKELDPTQPDEVVSRMTDEDWKACTKLKKEEYL